MAGKRKSKVKTKDARSKKPSRVFGKASVYKKGNPIQKRRGKEIYDIVLPNGQKEVKTIADIISTRNFNKINRGELPDNFVKITFVARFRKKRASISYIYDVDELEQVQEAATDIWKLILSKDVARKTKSLKRINQLRYYVNRIIFDFETAT